MQFQFTRQKWEINRFSYIQIIMNNNDAPKDEPTTSGKVILSTTHGEIEIELWCRQIPLACRNFVQLCLEGYYDNTIFHRMIPSFMIQGGDPTGTGLGGQSVYGGEFKDQFHQRLRFAKRGIVAMANSGKNTNKSQFFITFGECAHLNKKHSIFGKVVGDTIYNLLSFQSLDTDKNDRPNDPPYIRKTKVVSHPFDDIIPRNQQQKINSLETLNQQKKQKQQKQKIIKKQEFKKLKKKKKLTFDDEEIEENENKIVSSHDALEDGRLSKKLAVTQQDLKKKKQQKEAQEKKKKEIINKIHQATDQGIKKEDFSDLLHDEMEKKKKIAESSDFKMNVQDEVLNYKKFFNPETQKMEIYWGQKPIVKQEPQESSQNQQQMIKKAKQLQEQEFKALRADELNFKKLKQGSLKQRRKQLIADEKALLSTVQRKKYEYIKKNRMEKKEDESFQKLSKFTTRLLENKSNDWMTHKLKFHIDSENAYNLDRKNQERVNQNEKANYDDGLKVEGSLYAQNDEIDLDELYELTKKQ